MVVVSFSIVVVVVSFGGFGFVVEVVMVVGGLVVTDDGVDMLVVVLDDSLTVTSVVDVGVGVFDFASSFRGHPISYVKHHVSGTSLPCSSRTNSRCQFVGLVESL